MRILFLTAGRLGDAVLSTGLLARLLQTYPGAKVTVACGPAAAGIFEGLPNLEELIVIRKRAYSLHWLDLWRRLVLRRWDVVVDLRRSALGYFLAAGKVYRAPKSDPALHKVMDLARTLKLHAPSAPHVWISSEQRQQAQMLLPELGQKPVLCIGPAANWGGKTWPAERFAELARRLTAPNGILPGAVIALFGAESERDQTRRVLELLQDLPVRDLTGKPGLGACAAIFAEASLYIGNDSGLMHLAAASGGNVLGLFGPSPARQYAPYPSGGKTAFVQTDESYDQLVHSPSFDYRSQQSLMLGLSVDKAERAARDLWLLAGKREAA